VPTAAEKLLNRFGYKYERGASGFRTLPDGKPLVITVSTSTDTFYRDLDTLWRKSLQGIGLPSKSG